LCIARLGLRVARDARDPCREKLIAQREYDGAFEQTHDALRHGAADRADQDHEHWRIEAATQQ